MIGNEKTYEQFLEEERMKMSHNIYGDKSKIYSALQLTADKLKKVLVELSSVNEHNTQLKNIINKIKDKHNYAICLEITNTGKFKFPNETSRKVELNKRLLGNPECVEQVKILDSVVDRKLALELQEKVLNIDLFVRGKGLWMKENC